MAENQPSGKKRPDTSWIYKAEGKHGPGDLSLSVCTVSPSTDIGGCTWQTVATTHKVHRGGMACRPENGLHGVTFLVQPLNSFLNESIK